MGAMVKTYTIACTALCSAPGASWLSTAHASAAGRVHEAKQAVQESIAGWLSMCQGGVVWCLSIRKHISLHLPQAAGRGQAPGSCRVVSASSCRGSSPPLPPSTHQVTGFKAASAYAVHVVASACRYVPVSCLVAQYTWVEEAPLLLEVSIASRTEKHSVTACL